LLKRIKPYYKLLVCMSIYFMAAVSYKIVKATEANTMSEAARVEAYISALYKQVDFSTHDRLSYIVFNRAMHGYLNLKNSGKLTNKREIISICDFNQPSTVERLWIIDLAAKKVLYNTFVAHGQSTGEDCAVEFSNKVNSHQSSLGFYVTTNTYIGEHGLSLRLQGMDQGFNDAAMERDIVVHGAEYVCENFICDNQRLGRSWGCPAVPIVLAEPIINTIKDGTCLFIYYPQPKYLSSGYWLNKKITSLPDYNLFGAMLPTDINRPKFRRLEYYTNGNLDSVKVVPAE
jgi:hypothetical protein